MQNWAGLSQNLEKVKMVLEIVPKPLLSILLGASHLDCDFVFRSVSYLMSKGAWSDTPWAKARRILNGMRTGTLQSSSIKRVCNLRPCRWLSLEHCKPWNRCPARGWFNDCMEDVNTHPEITCHLYDFAWKQIGVKVVGGRLRGLEFSSSQRRDSGGPNAPERILGEKAFSVLFWVQKVQNLFRNEEVSESVFLPQGVKRLVNVTMF